MVKIQDGSLVAATDVFGGGVEDDEGQRLKFEPIKDAPIPRWEAKTKMNDGSNRTRNFSVSLIDVNLIVRMALSEEQATEASPEPKTQKVTKEVTPSPSSSATDTKKNSSPAATTSDHQKKYL